MIIRLFPLLFLIFSLSARIPPEIKQPTNPYFIVVSIPKSGTHLLTKCLSFLQPREELNITWSLGLPTWNNFDYPKDMTQFDRQLDRLINRHDYLISHSDLSYPVARFLNRHQEAKVLVCVRDLRDVFISQLYYSWNIIEKFIGPSSAEQKLDFLLTNENIHLNRELHVIYRHAESILQLTSHPRALVIRFEDLVGKMGGGDDAVQRDLIFQIASTLQVNLQGERATRIQNALFGNTVSPSKTFRSGQIGAWKTHFTPSQLDFFNKKFGHLQKALGYSLDR